MDYPGERTHPIIDRAVALLESDDVEMRVLGIFILAQAAAYVTNLSETPAQRAFWYSVVHSYGGYWYTWTVRHLEWFYIMNDLPASYLSQASRFPKEAHHLLRTLLEEHIVEPGYLQELLELVRGNEMWEYVNFQGLEPLAGFARALTYSLPAQNDELCRLVTESRDPLVRGSAALALGLNQEIGVISVLEQATKDVDAQVRRSAIHALGQFQDERVLDIMCNGLRDESPSVRLISANTLASLSTPQALHALGEALRNGPKSLRIDVAKAFVRATKNRDIALKLLSESAESEEDLDVLRSVSESIAEVALPPDLIYLEPMPDELREALKAREFCQEHGLDDAMDIIEQRIRQWKSTEGQENAFNKAWDLLTDQPQPNWLTEDSG